MRVFSSIRVIVLALGCAGAAAVADRSVAAEGVATTTGDTPQSAFQQLLDDYVTVVPVDGVGSGTPPVFETVFDYRALWRSPDRDARLAAVLEEIEAADPGAMDVAARIAFAINTYNALAIEVVIEGLEEKSGDLESIRDIGAGGGRVFEEERWTIHGRRYSLNGWERERVFGGPAGAGGKRAGKHGEGRGRLRQPDARAHFAVVCASLGCPSLLPEVYTGDRLSQQLDHATRNALANPRHLRLVEGKLRASPLFEWYRRDFDAAGGVLSFIVEHAPARLVEAIGAAGVSEVSADLDWDWSLNRPAPEARDDEASLGRPVHTYSIVARDPETGELGVAVQSHWFSVGPVVPWAESGVGAVATQSLVDISYGPLGLELMRAGKSAPEALAALVAADSGQALRQVAMVDASGRVAAHTGARCIAAAGHQTGKQYSVQANLMEKDTVWPAMARAYESASGDFAGRLLAALDAAQAEGGDIRGRQSAAILIVRGEASGRSWVDRRVDLRVEDHPEPLVELRRLLHLHRAYEHMNHGDELLGEGRTADALQAYAAAAEMVPEIVELPYWQAVTLAGIGKVDEALEIFRQVFEREPIWAELTPRLVESGLLPDDPALIERIRSVAPGSSAAPRKPGGR